MTINVKSGGVWKEATIYVKDGGTWKTVNEGYIKDSGTWKQFFMNRVAASITISSNTANYVLNTSKVTGYVAGKTDVTLTINSGVFVYSASTGSYALNVDTSWTTGDTITIINNGTILGRGGNGASYKDYNKLPDVGPGGNAGPALYVGRSVTINNGSGRIAGGGGGGGAGGYDAVPGCYSATGGGGGGGIGNGQAQGSYLPGTSGTLTSAGSGGPSEGSGSGTGGNGGGYGSAGSSGQGGFGYGPGPGGAAGAAVVGNSNITWTATGTRNGSIS